MKHIKIYEDFREQDQEDSTTLKYEDVSVHGDTVFCWNDGEGWLVALCDRSESEKFGPYLEDLEGYLTLPVEKMTGIGIAYVTAKAEDETEETYEVGFEGTSFRPQTSFFNNRVSSYGIEGDGDGSSCVFSLKKGMVISYPWAQGDVVTLPVSQYIEERRG